MRKEVMQEVAQLSQFDEELYKVIGEGGWALGWQLFFFSISLAIEVIFSRGFRPSVGYLFF